MTKKGKLYKVATVIDSNTVESQSENLGGNCPLYGTYSGTFEYG